MSKRRAYNLEFKMDIIRFAENHCYRETGSLKLMNHLRADGNKRKRNSAKPVSNQVLQNRSLGLKELVEKAMSVCN